MNKIDIVMNYLNKEKISGTKIFYGSCIENHSNTKDIDVCIITNQVIDEEFYDRYRQFLIDNKLVIDEEIRYEDKLFLSESKIESALESYSNQSENFDLENDYRDVVNRLIINIFTTKVKIFDDNGNYEEYSNRAWEKVLERFRNFGGSTFSDFIKIFKVNWDYKQYWGYSPKITKDLYNRFYQHNSESEFIRLLKTNVIKHPQKIAVYSEEKNLTYEGLDRFSDNVADSLLNFESEYVVVNYSHTYELLPIIFGILKSGKVYIPVDNTSPVKEIELIRKKFPESIYISEIESDLDIPKIFCSNHSIVNYQKNKLAYIIHTSGTTGVPKGVCVTTKNLNYIMRACQSFAPVSISDCYLFSTRNTFDVSITEIFGFLYNGGSVYLFSVKNKNFYKELPNIINKFAITHVALSPSVLGVLLKYSDEIELQYINQLKYLLIAGEEFKYELLKITEEKLKKVDVFNVYGPTETTVYATYFNVRDISESFRSKNKVPIGKPLLGVETLIIDNELLIGGQGVADGYYNDVIQTEKKFTKINGSIFYHTGDIVEESNSLLVYIGRQDSQIQLYGIRLELGDIRTSIAKIINDSKRDLEVVFDNNMLILFYTGDKINNIREMLEKEMISYKIPSKYINIGEFPLTSSGKIDKKLLLEKFTSNEIRNHEENNMHDIVLNVVESVMQQQIKPDENLLDTGLNSLNSVEIILELEERLNIDLGSLNLYVNSSIEEITKFIEKSQKSSGLKLTTIVEPKIKLKNIPLIRDIEYRYPTFFYARIYNTLNFDSQLTGKIYLRKEQISYEEIYYKLSKIEVFKSVLSNDLNYFEVLDTPINISRIEISDVRVDISEELRNLVKKSKENNGLLYKFVLFENESESVLHYSIDHSICDSSSLDALERYLLGVNNLSKNYSSYIKEVHFRNRLDILLKEVERFDLQDDDKVSEVLVGLNDKVNFTTLNYLSTETRNVYVEILLFLRDKFLKQYHLDNVKVNLIYNIRKFNEVLDFTSTIGDLHLGLTYNLNLNDDIEDALEELINFYKENMFNPKAIGYKNFPNIDLDEKNCKVF
ncbi:long-chain fatty acid--CoA ligase [Streptococcus pneumoniae]|uniref:non-ribosomal peptide synthetase n=2 Tax=Streptococcus pneumoniae TaxID=1313 RepID=UPI000802EB59|nr:non-ribosomal peptide synthetase [Streptococcus pneumoniae]OBX93625.1 long-chain fatty acid--CoA ligase [Streptococcus pneumoniae]VRE14125.1 long-chain-fatty-acid--CoA ligase [Streptococcus pneumoniae]